MTHRIGIIGLGAVGGRFVEMFGRHDAFDVVAAWDVNDAACARYADQVTITSDSNDVIAAADAVYIAVPPHHHREYVEACLAADTAVFCEKPLGTDVAESEQLVAAVEASGLAAGVNFVYSAAPAAIEIIDAATGGGLGNVVGADLRLHFAHWPRAFQAEATWLADRSQGGWMREVASHHVFLLGRALGAGSLRSASVQFPDGPDGHLCERDAVVELEFGGLPVTLVGTVGGAAPDVAELTVRGDERSMRIADWYRISASDGTTWEPSGDADRAVLADAAYRAQLDEVDAMLAGRPHRIATFREALDVQRLVEQILSS